MGCIRRTGAEVDVLRRLTRVYRADIADAFDVVLNSLLCILAGIRVKLCFAPGRAEVVRLTVVFALTCGLIRVDLHSAHDVTFHTSSLKSSPLII